MVIAKLVCDQNNIFDKIVFWGDSTIKKNKLSIWILSTRSIFSFSNIYLNRCLFKYPLGDFFV